MHLSVPAPHVPAPHVPALRAPARQRVLHLTGRRPPLATLLLTVVYAAAVAVALTAPAQHAFAGCAVLAGVTARAAVHRRRSAAGAAATAAVDLVVALPRP